ncbi:MAG: cupin domain-containing protein [Hyphomicrobiales bacterium]|nr:cupin domain-containing protein [Hyphomicrobiales bacterium]
MPRIDVDTVPAKPSDLPEPYRSEIGGRTRAALGDAVGLTQFGVNYCRLPAGSQSSIDHWHESEDEFIFVVEGTVALVDGGVETLLAAGDAAGFKAGVATGHHIQNRSGAAAAVLEIGTRAKSEVCHFPGRNFRLEIADRVESVVCIEPGSAPASGPRPAAAKVNQDAIEWGGRSLYPAAYQHVVAGRERKRLGDAVGLTQFGVNLTRLAPGGASALRHWHENEDEFIFVVEGEAVLVENDGETILKAGDGAGFKAGVANGHHLINRSNAAVVYLEAGTRAPRERAHYSDVDLTVERDGQDFTFCRRDGTPTA